jgi:hypothetical protein
MEILWLAILFYSVGLAAVLHFRPALMFNENGTWKEFGYHRAASARYTMFPVWLFAIAWAIVSYTLAAAIVWTWRLSPSVPAAMMAVPAGGLFASRGLSEEEMEEEDGAYNVTLEEDDMVPVSSATTPAPPPPAMTETIRMRPSAKRIQTPARQPRMGYYVLDPVSEKSGLRRYIYYGEAPPPQMQSASV